MDAPVPLRPSAHAVLTAQWEWRTMKEGGGATTDTTRFVVRESQSQAASLSG